MKCGIKCVLPAVTGLAMVLSVAADTVELASLDLSSMSAGDGKVTVDTAVPYELHLPACP